MSQTSTAPTPLASYVEAAMAICERDEPAVRRLVSTLDTDRGDGNLVDRGTASATLVGIVTSQLQAFSRIEPMPAADVREDVAGWLEQLAASADAFRLAVSASAGSDAAGFARAVRTASRHWNEAARHARAAALHPCAPVVFDSVDP